MKKFSGLMVVAVLLLAQNGFSQSYAETAMMFTRTKPTGSARILGMGGAQVSLGGDVSSAYSNPAGLGMYNRSEFSFTPGYALIKTNGDYFSGNTRLSSDNSESMSNLNMTGLGLALSRELNKGPLLQGTFAITMSRTNSFNRKFGYKGLNEDTSLIDYFLKDATGETPDQFSSGGALYNTDTELAYNNYLIGEATIIDPNNDPTDYFTDVSGKPYQQELIEQQGRQTQWNFSYGANFMDKFYVGAGLGIASINYSSAKSYSEDFEDDPLSNYTLDESLEIRGTGVNLKLGAIARPVNFMTIGLSMVTPTLYSVTDTWTADMNSKWNNWEYTPGQFINEESASTDAVLSEYNLKTPWRWSAGATFFIQKFGLITMDVERVNYGGAKYSSTASGASYDQDNSKINSIYTGRTNWRLGAEARLSAFRLRAGVGLMPDPQAGPQNVSNTWSTASVGAGYRNSKFAFDVAYVKMFANGTFKITKNSFDYFNDGSQRGNVYRPYTAGQKSPSFLFNQESQNFVATIGFLF